VGPREDLAALKSLLMSEEERLRRGYSARSLVTTTTMEPRFMHLIML